MWLRLAPRKLVTKKVSRCLPRSACSQGKPMNTHKKHHVSWFFMMFHDCFLFILAWQATLMYCFWENNIRISLGQTNLIQLIYYIMYLNSILHNFHKHAFSILFPCFPMFFHGSLMFFPCFPIKIAIFAPFLQGMPPAPASRFLQGKAAILCLVELYLSVGEARWSSYHHYIYVYIYIYIQYIHMVIWYINDHGDMMWYDDRIITIMVYIYIYACMYIYTY